MGNIPTTNLLSFLNFSSAKKSPSISKPAAFKKLVFVLAGFILLFNYNSYSATTLGTCAAPTNVTIGSAVSATITIGQTATNPPSPTCTYNQAEGWGKFTAGATVVVFNMGTFSKTWALEVYSGSCGSLTLNSNYCAAGTGGGALPMGPLVVGNTYYFRFMNNSSTAGSMTLSALTLYNGGGTCANPYQLTLGTATGSNFYISSAPTTTPAWSGCPSGNNAEGWFSFASGASYACISITTISQTSALQVFDGSPCSGGTAVYCLSTLASATAKLNWFATNPGDTYYFRIIETSSTTAMTCNLVVYNAAQIVADACTDATGYVYSSGSTLIPGTIHMGYDGTYYHDGYAKFITSGISSTATAVIVAPYFAFSTVTSCSGTVSFEAVNGETSTDPCSASGSTILGGIATALSSAFSAKGYSTNTYYSLGALNSSATATGTAGNINTAISSSRGWWLMTYYPTSWGCTGLTYDDQIYGTGSSYPPYCFVAYTGGCTPAAPSLTATADGSSSSPVYNVINTTVSLSQTTTGGTNCGAWKYAWSNDGGTTFWNGTTFSGGASYNTAYSTITPTISANTTYTCYVEGTGSGSSLANSAITVDVVTLPAITAKADGTTGETIATGVTVALTANPSGGSGCTGTIVYAWSNSGGAANSFWNGSAFSGASAAATYNASYSSITTPTLSANTTFTCYEECTTATNSSLSSAASVTIGSCSPPTLTAEANGGTGTVDVSPGGTVALTANASGGNYCNGGGAWVYAWSNDGGTTFWNGSAFSGSASYNSSYGSISFTASGSGNTTYNVYAQCANNSGCASTTNSVIVQVATSCVAPTVTAKADGTTGETISYNSTVALTANPGGGANCSGNFIYAWSNDGGTTFWNGSAFSGSADYDPSFSSISVANVTTGATYTVYVECSADGTCNNTSSVTVGVGSCSAPSLTAKANGTAGTLTTCSGTTITLTANASGGAYCSGNYAWSNDGGTTYWNGSAFSGGSNYNSSYSSISFTLGNSSNTYTCYVQCSSPGCNNSSAVTINITAPAAPIFSNTLGTQQLAFNNSYINSSTPYFYLTATSTCVGTYNTLLIDINTNSTFTGTDYTQTFSGTYTSGTGNDFQFTNGIPTTDGVTYYVRAEVANDGGTNWSAWSSGTYSFTYNATAGNPAWLQQAQGQFSTDALSGITSNANYLALTSTAGGSNILLNPSFESGLTSWNNTSYEFYSANCCYGVTANSTTDVTNGSYSADIYIDDGFSGNFYGGDYTMLYQDAAFTGLSNISLSWGYANPTANSLDCNLNCGNGDPYGQFLVLVDNGNTNNYITASNGAKVDGTTIYSSSEMDIQCNNSTSGGPYSVNIPISSYNFTGTCRLKLVAYIDGYPNVYCSGTYFHLYLDNVLATSTPSGTATSTVFNRASIQGANKWGSLIWNQTQNGGTINLAVQQYTGGAWANVSGFTGITSASDGSNSFSLAGLASTIDSIKLVATFATTTGAASSPQLNSWEVTPVIAPTLTAEANSTSGTDIECSGASVTLTANPTNIPSGACSGSWQYAWYNGSSFWNGASFSSGTPLYNSGYTSISIGSVSSTATYSVYVNCSTNSADSSNSSVALTVVSASVSGLTAAIGSPAVGSSRVTTVSWSAVTGATGYDLDYSTDDATWTNLFTNSNVVTYNHAPGDHPNAPYYYRIRVHTGSAQCGYVSYGPIYTAADVPSLPTLSSATTNTMTVTIGSGDGNPSITTYAIYCSTTGQYVQANGTLGSSAVYQTASTWGTTTLTGLSINTNYCFYEIAANYQAYQTTNTGTSLLAVQTFATSGTLSTSGSTSLWDSPSSCTGSSEITWHSGDGCNGSAGAVGYTTSPGTGDGCYLRSPTVTTSGSPTTVSMTLTLTNTASSLGDYIGFYIYSNTNSTYYPSGFGGTPVVVSSINGVAGSTFALSSANSCLPLTITWDLTSIPAADRASMLFYIQPYFNETSGTSMNVLFDNIAINGATPTQCLSTTKPNLCGNFQVGPTGDYASLTAVAAALSSSTVTCNTTFNLQTTYTSSSETFPITFSGITYGSGGPFTIAIRPDTSVSTPLVTSGSSTSALITLSGVADVTLDGRPGGNGTTPYWTIQNTSTSSAGPAVELTAAANTDTLEYLTMLSSNQTTTSGTVYLYPNTTTNSGDVIQNCNIGPNGSIYPFNGICLYGNATTAINTGTKILNNDIHDFIGTAATGVIVTGTGSNTDYADNITISGNSFYRSILNSLSDGSVIAIDFLASPGGSGTSTGNTISNNYIGGLASARAGGQILGTWVTAANSSSQSFTGIWADAKSVTISGNVIGGIFDLFGESSAGFAGIYVPVTASGGTVSVTGNTIGSTNEAGKLDFGTSSTSLAIVSSGSATLTTQTGLGFQVGDTVRFVTTNFFSSYYEGYMEGNVTAYNSGTGSITINVVRSLFSTSTGTGWNIMLAGGCMNNGQYAMVGIWSSQSNAISITNNTIGNLANTNSNSFACIGIYSSAGTNTITGNTIYNLYGNFQTQTVNTFTSTNSNLTNFSCPTGIAEASSASSAVQTVSNNTIYNLNYISSSISAQYNISGIEVSGTTGVTHIMNANLVYGFGAPSSNTAPCFTGILLHSGSQWKVTNNLVDLGLRSDASANTTSVLIDGIIDAEGGASVQQLFYHNSIYIGGAGVASGTVNTYCYRRFNSNSSPKDEVDMRNNIFLNNRSNSSGSGKHYCISYDSNNNLSASTEDWNECYGTGTGFTLAQVNSVDETSYSALTSAAANSNFDLHSLSSDPTLTAPTSVPPDFHLQPGSPCDATGATALLTLDYYGVTRSTATPTDLGAVALNVTNSITTSNVSGPYCAGAAVTVNFTSVVSYTSGNVYTAQLSDASGNFGGSPTTIGTLTSTATGSLSITANPGTLPSNATTSSLYVIRVIASSPSVTGSSTTAFTINALPTVSFTGLASSYCSNASSATLTGNQAPNGTFSGAGITDNGNGTATFSPSGAGAGGPYTITYTYNGTCSNSSTGTVTVNAAPTVSFTGLASSYCVSASSVTLTGNHSSGTFSGTGITDHGNGTATFSPPGAGAGGPYTITYTYSNGTCSNSSTGTVTVNALPTVAAIGGGASSVCVSSSTAAFTDATSGGSWSITPGTGTASITSGGIATGLTAGSVTVVYTYSNGTCSNTATTALTVSGTSSSTTNHTACNSYFWNGTTYTTGGSYSFDAGNNAAGCDSVANINLTINYSSSSTTNHTACNSYVWNGTTYTTGGAYSFDAGANAVGCDSTANINLTINYSSSSTTNHTACNSYLWNGTTYTTSGAYAFDAGANAVGCDSTANINLTINYSSSSTTNHTACNSYLWNGTTYTTSGAYAYDGGANAVGCDSTANINLTINYSSSSTTNHTACNSYLWNGTTYTTSGAYSFDAGANAVGCDSTANINLTINYSSSSTTNHTACNSYLWNGTTYTTSGAYSFDAGANAVGCDSTANINLTINYSSSSTTNHTACNSYLWNGTTYTTSGSYSFDAGSNAAGCDSIANINLTINYSSSSTTNHTACNSYVWNGTTYTTGGSYSHDAGSNAAGCDSVANINLTINYSSSSTTNHTACNSYLWNGTTYTSGGSYSFDAGNNAAGCDSVANINLTINYSNSSTTSHTACNSYLWNGTTYTTGGAYSFDAGSNAAGCDSVANINLTINYSTSSTTSHTACNSYLWNGTTYTTGGAYSFDAGSNAAGCDSVANINLTINYSSSSTTNHTACNSYLWNGTTYTTGGSYSYDAGSNAAGCDSVANINLTINYSSSSTTNHTACNSYLWNSTTYTTGGSYSYDAGSNAAGCDSVANINLTINYSSSSTTGHTACNSYLWNGTTYTTGGSYSFDAGSNAAGCDSVANINLTINYSSSSTTSHTACNNYLWNGTTYTTGGSYSFDAGSNAAGCDSVANINLTINYSSSSTTNYTACDSYMWNGTTYTSSGLYSYDAGSNASGCDSVANINLTIHSSPTVAAIGDGASSVCANSSTPAFTDATTGGTWSITAGTGTASVTTDGVVTGLTAGMVTVVYTYSNGTCSAAAATSLTINALPNIAAIGDGASSVCVNSSTAAFTDATAGGTWSVSPETGTASISGGGVVTGLSAGTVLVVYTYSDGTCSTAAATSLTVNALPSVSFSGLSSNYCTTASSVTLTGNQAPGGTFSGTGITDNGDGTATFSPSTAGAGGPYTITYTYSNGTCSNSTSQTVTVNNCALTFTVHMFLQGYYLGGNQMSPLLHLLGATSTTAVDTVTIELHDSGNTHDSLFAYRGVLNNDGSMVCTFPSGASASYYIVVKHRNSLETWSAAAQSVSGGSSYDFTSGGGQAYGTGSTINLGGGVYAIYSGDVNQDGNIDSSDQSSIQGNLSSFLIGVYDPNDITGDGMVDEDDLRIIQNNITLSISKQVPH